MNDFTDAKHLLTQATVSSKGQITLPTQLRKQLGIVTGTKINMAIDPATQTATLSCEKPISAYRGLLKSYNLPADFADIPKEEDRY